MPDHSLVKTSCAILLFLLLGFFAKAQQPVAAFTATPVSGCAPLVVNFTDQSGGNPTSWHWDLGNATVSFLQNPSVTYFNPGLYSIKLVVQNAAGKDSITKTQYISVAPQPVVNFSANRFAGCFPLPVQFTDLSSAGNGGINSWQWDFGDGATSTAQSPAHTYTAAGNFNVSLRVGNSGGCFKTLTKSQYIQVSQGVHADFTNSAPNNCSSPVNIVFQNASTGTGVLTYLWDFGDGGTSSQTNPAHNYTVAGSYTVKLIVTNSTGCTDTLIRQNAITIGTVDAAFTSPSSVCVNNLFIATNTSSPAPVSATWDFGDGTTANSINGTKLYAAPGTYTVKLLSDFGACTDSAFATITVLPKPQAAFTGNPLSSCTVPRTVNFTSTSIGAITYEWNFGDGGTSTLQNPSHVYSTPGNFSVTLVATNASGCTDTLTKADFVKIALPVVSINNLPQLGCGPFSWTFSSTLVSSEPAVSYSWDFGDGGTSASANPTHIFAAGDFTITVTITTASGCTAAVTVPAGIRVGTKPSANFVADPLDVCANLPVNFTDLSTGTITEWQWDFGDGATSAQQNPTHNYDDTGVFTIRLIVLNNGCADTLIRTNYVHVKPPIAIFTPSINCAAPFTTNFTDGSIGADTWSWNFGDGNTSNVPSPVHTYAATGTYGVSLTVTNAASGCSFTRSQDLRIIHETADFTGDAIVCRNSAANFTAINSNAGNINSYAWTFGDGGTGTSRTTAHTYTTPGIYDVSLITTDLNGCTDTIIKTQFIRVNGPSAGFSPAVAGSCLQSNVSFTDQSAGDGTHPIVQWVWDFGDGNIQTYTNGPFQHSYTTAGIYTVTLTVTDNAGCSDLFSMPNAITVSSPQAIFTASDTSTCPAHAISFSNTSTGPGLVYVWNFGDGATSNLAAPTHNYATDGIYTVSLSITDQYGCTSSLVKTNYISISTPVAAFTMSDSVSTCPPLVVNFTSQSQNAVSLNWDFGDGSSSQLSNPTHFYNIPGAYTIILTVTGQGGCTSTKQRTVVVRGPQGTFTYTPLAGCKPLQVNFSAITRDRTSFIWDFNDGTTQATTDSIITHIYTVPGIYVPKMILKDNNGCLVPVTGLDTIIVNGVTAGFTTDTSLLCNNGAVQFSNTTVSNDVISGYSWDFGDGTTSTQQNPVHFYATVGNYFPKLKAVSQTGCTDSIKAVIPVRVIKQPEINIGQTSNGCTPLTVTFTGQVINPDTSALRWEWSFGNAQQSSLKNPLSQIYTIAGSYPVQTIVTNSSGCKDTATTTINAFAIPLVNAGVDTMICKGTGVGLQATGALTYSWTPATGLSCVNCANPIANPDSLRKYIVTGANADGCFAKDTIEVSVTYPFKMLISRSDTLCQGQSMRLTATGAHSYSWTPSAGLITNNNLPSVTVAPQTSTTYRVVGSDGRNCFSDTGYVPVKVYPIPTVNAGPDQTINVGQMTDLIPTLSADVTKVIWTPSGELSRNNYPAITVKPRQTTEYTVTATNPGGCSSTDNLTVFVLCNGTNVFIPNTFSPNGDGSNDVFFPRGTGLFSIKNVKIFNRWGEVVFQKNNFSANDAAAGWDGLYKGQKLLPDVFIYVMEILCDNNTVLTYKGNVALIK
ncbi:MAG: hypothetical protein JWQ27_1975 [Ferruginibacter sp.]|nr:hypothetical protein [Ferruginibacter sp.]